MFLKILGHTVYSPDDQKECSFSMLLVQMVIDIQVQKLIRAPPDKVRGALK